MLLWGTTYNGRQVGDFVVCKPMVVCQGSALGLVEAFEAPQQIKMGVDPYYSMDANQVCHSPRPPAMSQGQGS